MRKSSFLLVALAVLSACDRHFISDRNYRAAVTEDYADRMEIMTAAGVDLDAMGLETDEKEALEFLYAYMPLGDIVNNTPEFYHDHYRMSLRALEEMPWETAFRSVKSVISCFLCA